MSRLGVVVRVKEKSEEKARRDLARADAEARRAREVAEQARAELYTERRARGDASTWQLAEVAQVRAVSDSRRAEHLATASEKKAAEVRERHVEAWRSLEAVRRVAEARREEQAVEERRKERRDTDEIAILLHGRTG